MTKSQNDQPHWDGEQWAKDEPVDKTAAEQGETWKGEQWVPDEKHPDSPGDDVTTPTGQGPGETGPTGRGMASGESHFDRVDHDR